MTTAVRAALAVAALLTMVMPAQAQDTHLVVITGVEGDPEHGAQFHKWATALIDAAKAKGGVADSTITYLADKVERDPGRVVGLPGALVVAQHAVQLGRERDRRQGRDDGRRRGGRLREEHQADLYSFSRL